MKERNLEESLKEYILKDPILACFIEKTLYPGINIITKNRTEFIIYQNRKAGTHASIDPWTEEITIAFHDKTKPPITLHYKEALKLLKKIFGEPEIFPVPKIQTNIPEVQELINKMKKGKPR
jgi:hypothetical protein